MWERKEMRKDLSKDAERSAVVQLSSAIGWDEKSFIVKYSRDILNVTRHHLLCTRASMSMSLETTSTSAAPNRRVRVIVEVWKWILSKWRYTVTFKL